MKAAISLVQNLAQIITVFSPLHTVLVNLDDLFLFGLKQILSTNILIKVMSIEVSVSCGISF